MEPIIVVEGALATPDGYWRVEIVHQYGRTTRWYRIFHATTMVADYAAIATVQRVLGDAFGTLTQVEAGDNGVA